MKVDDEGEDYSISPPCFLKYCEVQFQRKPMAIPALVQLIRDKEAGKSLTLKPIVSWLIQEGYVEISPETEQNATVISYYMWDIPEPTKHVAAFFFSSKDLEF